MYTDLAVYDMNKYIWVQAQALTPDVWDVSKYNSIVPIYPVTDSNSIQDDAPYILYDTLFETRMNDIPQMITERVTYHIIGDVPDILYVRRFMYDIFSRLEDSAATINEISTSCNTFKYTEVWQDTNITEFQEPKSIRPRMVTSLKVKAVYTQTR